MRNHDIQVNYFVVNKKELKQEISKFNKLLIKKENEYELLSNKNIEIKTKY
jgi:hypothetical protein